MKKETEKKATEKLLEKAREHYKILSAAESDIKDAFIKDMKFAFNIGSGQWDEADVTARDEEGRPHLTMNKLSKFVAQVVNAEKGLPNTDDIIPVDDKGDIQVARIYNELIQDIEYRSEAEDVYSMAAEHAAGGGFGYWRILTEYCADGFDQEIKIKPIKNPCMVSLDPKGNFAFIREALSEEEFKEQYPESEMTDFESYSGNEDYELWYQDNKVFIAEYFVKVPKEKEIVEIQNPVTGETGVAEKIDEHQFDNLKILRTRKVQTYEIKWYKISGTEILDEGIWPGTEIPIVEVSGHEIHLLGKTYKKSLITDAKDGQRGYNYWLTSLTEKVALAPKAPFIVTPQQIKGFEDDWRNANIKNLPYLQVNPGGQSLPQRTPVAPVDPGAMTLIQLFDNNIKDIMGMYESSLGMQSNERSGKAINARNSRSDLGVYSFQENLRKAKIKTKKILIELIPKIYDNARIIRLRGVDQNIQINYPVMINGQPAIFNDLSKGRYDIRVRSAGSPSRRQQTADNIIQAMQYAGPQYAPVLLPLLMKYLDVPGSEEIAGAIMQAIQSQSQAQSPGGQPQGQPQMGTQ